MSQLISHRSQEIRKEMTMKTSFLKKAVLGLAGIAAVVVLATGTARAISIPYEGPNTPPAPSPAFNVFTGVPSVGTESDFLRSRVPTAPTGDTSTPYVDPLTASCTKGQRIQMRVYVHNGATKSNNNGGNGSSVAHGTKVKVALPTEAASVQKPSATISSTNAGTVNDGAIINCNGKTVKLKYIAGSASQYSIGTGVVPLSDSIVTTGVPISSQGKAGDVWGCWDERVYVILAVEVEEVTPPTPVYSCDLLTVSKIDNRKYKFDVKYTAKNGATFKDVSFNYGDGQTGSSNEHTFDKDGVYNVVATVNFMVNGQAKSATSEACAKPVTVTKENCEVPGKENYPKDAPECKVCETNPNVPSDSEECTVCPSNPSVPVTDATCVEQPTELPNTGAGSVAGIFAAVTAAGALAHRFMTRRRING